MRHYLIAGAVLPLVLACAPALAQEAAPVAVPAVAEAAPAVAPAAAETPVAPPAPAVCCTAPKNTIVQIAVVPVISTKTIKPGDKFEIRLAEPIVVDGQVILPAGVTGGGEVVHASRPSIGGKPAELILAARYLDYEGRRIPLKAFKLGRTGEDNSDASLIISMVTPVGMFIPGGHIELKPDTRANAKLAADLTLPPVAVSAPAPAAEPAVATEAAPTQEQ